LVTQSHTRLLSRHCQYLIGTPNRRTKLIFHFTTLGPKIVKCTLRCIHQTSLTRVLLSPSQTRTWYSYSASGL
jgi:hypothetical protein